MSAFGILLKKCRHQSRDRNSGRPLTQERLAELLSLQANIEGYSGSTVSNWERGLNQIRRDDRHILVALITVLHQAGGIKTQDIANQLLFAGNYRPLDEAELMQIDPHWHLPNIDEPFSLATQEAMLPAPSYTRLFGVDDLIADIIGLLQAAQPQLIMLTGIGGMGKTAVADAVARQVIQDNLFAQVVWITFESDNSQTEPNFQTIIKALGEQLLPENNQEWNFAKLLTRLRFKLQQRPHLIVIDDLAPAPDSTTLFNELQGLIGQGKCLLTARNLPPVEVEVATIALPTLSFKNAVKLLHYQAKATGISMLQHVNEQEFKNLYQIVGGHPLALRLIPRLARMYPLSEILKGWQNEQPGYISDVYRFVYDELWLSLSSAEQQLMHVMPLISRNGGTLDYLQALSGLAAEAVWANLTELMECCLIEPHGNLYEHRYAIHHLTEQYVSNRASSQEDNVEFSAAVIQRGLSYWQQFFTQLPELDWHTVDREQENIFRLLAHSLTLPTDQHTVAIKECWLQLFDFLFRYIEQRGHATKWLPLLESVANHFPEQSPEHLHLLNRVGELYRFNHDLQKAIRLHNRVLQFAQKVENEVEIARAHFNLGSDYTRYGEYATAIEHGHLALEIFEQLQLLGRERAATLDLLGRTVRRQEQLGLSSDYLREAAEIWRDLNCRPELARTLRNLASVLQARNDISGAQYCYDEAKKVLAQTASELDRILIYLAEGTFYFQQEQYKEAETEFKCIDLEYLESSGHQYYYAYTLNNLGNVAYIHKRYDEANHLLQKSIQIWEQLGEPFRMANSLGKLGDVLVRQEKEVEGRQVYMHALRLLEQYDNDGLMLNLKQDLIQDITNLEDKK